LAELTATLRIIDNFTKPFQDFEDRAKAAAKANEELSKKFEHSKEAFKTAGLAFSGIGASIGGAMLFAAKAFADEEEAIITAASVTQTQGEVFKAVKERIGEFANEMETRMPFSAKKYSEAITTLQLRAHMNLDEAMKNSTALLYLEEKAHINLKVALSQAAEAKKRGVDMWSQWNKMAQESLSPMDHLRILMNTLGNVVEEFGATIAKEVVPWIDKMTESVKAAWKWYQSLSDGWKTAITYVVAFVGAITGLIGSLALMGAGAIKATAILKSMINVIILLSQAIIAVPYVGWIAGIVAAVVALYAAWKTNFGHIRDTTKLVLEALKAGFDFLMSAIGNVVNTLLHPSKWRENMAAIGKAWGDTTKKMSDALFEFGKNTADAHVNTSVVTAKEAEKKHKAIEEAMKKSIKDVEGLEEEFKNLAKQFELNAKVHNATAEQQIKDLSKLEEWVVKNLGKESLQYQELQAKKAELRHKDFEDHKKSLEDRIVIENSTYEQQIALYAKLKEDYARTEEEKRDIDRKMAEIKKKMSDKEMEVLESRMRFELKQAEDNESKKLEILKKYQALIKSDTINWAKEEEGIHQDTTEKLKGLYTDAYKTVADTFSNALSDNILRAQKFEGFWKDFTDNLKKVFIQKMTEIAANEIFKTIANVLTGGAVGGGGLFGGLLGGIGKLFGFAEGGVITRPTLAVVGEKGPEVVTPLSRSGGAATIGESMPSVTINLHWAPAYSFASPAEARQAAILINRELQKLGRG